MLLSLTQRLLILEILGTLMKTIFQLPETTIFRFVNKLPQWKFSSVMHHWKRHLLEEIKLLIWTENWEKQYIIEAGYEMI